MGMLCNERESEEGRHNGLHRRCGFFHLVPASRVRHGDGLSDHSCKHRASFQRQNETNPHLQFQIRPGWIDRSRQVLVWFLDGTHEMTVEGSQLFAYHALDTICGRHPVRASVGRICCCAGGHRATALRRKEGERGRGCARGGGGGCEDDYPEAVGGKEAARGQFRGLFH